MARLIFVNRFYWPDETATAQLLTDLAEALARRGAEVVVIASRPPGAPREEKRGGVRIVRIGSSRAGSAGLAAKALDFATFLGGAAWRGFRLARREDTLAALTDPPLIGVAVGLAARARSARLVHWAQDIYPEVALALGAPRILDALRPMRDRAWRRAAACVTLGRDMASTLAAAGVRPDALALVPNWPPAGLAPAGPERVQARRRAWGLEGRFVAVYSGNLGRVHDIRTLLEAAALLKGDTDTVLAFIGGGARRAEAESDARRLGLDNVRFLPAQPREALAETLSAADVHLVSLRPGCERAVFPSKIYGAAAAGRPIVFVGPPGCEPARLVEEGGFGRAVASGDAPALAAALRSLRDDPGARAALGAAAERFAREAPGAEAAAGVWLGILSGSARR